MTPIQKTLENPHGLSNKQRLVIADIINDVKTTGRVNIKKSHKLFYEGENTSVISSKNLSTVNFREALIENLQEQKIIGADSKVSRVLLDGLDATDLKGNIDHKTRLLFVQEINKITGMYAPERIDKRTLKLNMNVSSEELHNKINQLQSELGYTS